MKQYMLSTMAEMKAVAIKETPVYKWKLALLRDARLKLPLALLYKTVGRLQVNVNHNFMNDAELWDASLDSVAVTLSKLWQQVVADIDPSGPTTMENAYEYFLGIIGEFKLEYNA